MDLTIFDYQDNQLRTFIDEHGNPWFCVKDVCEMIGLKGTQNVCTRLDHEDVTQSCVFDTKGRKNNALFCNESGLYDLVLNSRKPKAIELAKILDVDVKYISHEQYHIGMIIKAIEGLIDYREQYQVGSYRIDLYLPVLKMAIECDEYDHKNYDIKEEISRQKYIEKILGCKFIRFNPNTYCFNIGCIINQIYKLHIGSKEVKYGLNNFRLSR